MQDYRNEVKEFFAGDEQLAAEVEFALKTAEKEREVREQMENCNVTPGAQTPTAKVIEQSANVTANSFNLFWCNIQTIAVERLPCSKKL